MKAFPNHRSGGMDLRDWLAGMALQGYLAAFSGEHVSLPSPETTATAAYKYADEMMKARDR